MRTLGLGVITAVLMCVCSGFTRSDDWILLQTKAGVELSYRLMGTPVYQVRFVNNNEYEVLTSAQYTMYLDDGTQQDSQCGELVLPHKSAWCTGDNYAAGRQKPLKIMRMMVKSYTV